MAGATSEILYGFHPVREALLAGRRTVEALLIRQGRENTARMETLRRLATRCGVALHMVAERQIDGLVGHTGHQGVCARVSPLPYWDLSAIAAPANDADAVPFLVLLDQLQDPHNLGAVVRTAYCAGADGIVIPRDRASAPSPTVSKASAGALEHMPVARVPNLVNAMRYLKQKGLWMVGLDGAATQSLFECDLAMPLGLLVGGEEKGLRPLVKRHCDFLVAIPHARTFNSLNASVAASLALFEVFRHRTRSGGHV